MQTDRQSKAISRVSQIICAILIKKIAMFLKVYELCSNETN